MPNSIRNLVLGENQCVYVRLSVDGHSLYNVKHNCLLYFKSITPICITFCHHMRRSTPPIYLLSKFITFGLLLSYMAVHEVDNTCTGLQSCRSLFTQKRIKRTIKIWCEAMGSCRVGYWLYHAPKCLQWETAWPYSGRNTARLICSKHAS
jgi:hypothetical protein